jgi:hypothetical protein
LVGVLYNLIALFQWIYLDINAVCREQYTLLADRILALTASVSPSVLFVAVHKYLIFLTPSVPSSLTIWRQNVVKFQAHPVFKMRIIQKPM